MSNRVSSSGLQVDGSQSSDSYLKMDKIRAAEPSDGLIADQYSDKIVGAPGLQSGHQYAGSPLNPQSQLQQTGYVEAPARRLPWGLSTVAYTILIVIVTALAVGGIVGGAVGGALSSSDSSSSTAAPTATTTMTTTFTLPATSTAAPTGLVNAYAPLPPDQVNTTVYSCTDNQQLAMGEDAVFTLQCNLNYPGNDILTLVAYTVEDCLAACKNLNRISGTGTCAGFLFNINLQSTYSRSFGNCWLKSTMGSSNPDPGGPSIAGTLIS